jgi:hypothetical protein
MLLDVLLRMLAAGMSHSEYTYVVRGASLKCSQGTDDGVLNLPECHGIYSKDQPVMSVADAVFDTHVSVFGFCKITQQPCAPEFCTPWSDGQENVLIDREPALLSKSKLICSANGGEITIKNDGQV